MTLKQIISRLEMLARQHQQINHWFIGTVDEFLDSGDIIYPAVFCEVQSDSNISLDNRVANFDFTFHFLDLMDVADRSLNNVWDVTSDMASVAMDYVAMLNDVTFTDWEVSQDYAVNIRDYQLQDLTCGVSIDVTIGTRFDANRCQVPSTYPFVDYDSSNLTLRQILDRLQALALSHRQINHYFCGSFDEFLDDADVTYPAVFGELSEGATLSITDRLMKYNFNFYFFDLVDVSDNALRNQWDVKSDMASVAMDFLSMLNDVSFRHSWDIGTEYTLSIRDYELQDLTCGVMVSVEIATRFDANNCQVPVRGEGFLLWDDGQYYLIDNTNKLIHGQ